MKTKVIKFLGAAMIAAFAQNANAQWTPGPNVELATPSDNVGLGLTPAFKLDVDGDVNIRLGTSYRIGGNIMLRTDALDAVYVGNGAGAVNTADFNVFVGKSSGSSNTTGRWNTVVGNAALFGNITGQKNTIMGSDAGRYITSNNNTAIGAHALHNNLGGYSNTAVGCEAGSGAAGGNEMGYSNTFVGGAAGRLNINGYDNTYLGDGSGSALTMANHFQNNFLGKLTMLVGDQNVAIGNQARGTGNRNLLFGHFANVTGTGNLQMGYVANGTGNYNILLGYEGLTSSGDHSVSIGSHINNAGGYNISLGYYAKNTGTGNLNMGYLTEGTGNYNVLLGYESKVVSGDNSISVGSYTNNTGDYNINLGYTSNVNGTNNISLGRNVISTGGNNINMGYLSNISGGSNIAIGLNSNNSGDNNVCLGGNTFNNGGDGNTLLGASTISAPGLYNATAVGTSTYVATNNTLVLGNYNNNTTTVIGSDGNWIGGGAYQLEVNGDAYATGSWLPSDANFKKNIKAYNNAMDVINQLNPVSYYYKDDVYFDHKGKDGKQVKRNFAKEEQIGFLAQDLEKVLPNMVRTHKDGTKAVNYNQLFGVLTQGIKEQSATTTENKNEIATLKEENTKLISMINELKSRLDAIEQKAGNSNIDTKKEIPADLKGKIEQIAPNPFSENVVVNYFVPQTAAKANMVLRSDKATQSVSFDINNKGNNSITLSGTNLLTGLYLCELYVDGQLVDTQKIMLVK